MSGITGGDKLLKLLEHMDKGMSSAASVDVGWTENNIHPETGVPTAEVAYANEMGTDKIPARPFIRPAELKNQKVWSDSLGKYTKAALYNAELALEFVGEDVKKDLQASMLEVTDPPLSPITIERKGHDKPLIDTTHMIDSIEVEVKK